MDVDVPVRNEKIIRTQFTRSTWTLEQPIQHNQTKKIHSAYICFLCGIKGCEKTLAHMDEEMSRSEDAINRRSILSKTLRIEKLLKRNKQEGRPYKTILEVIVKHLMMGRGSASATNITKRAPITATPLMRPTSAFDRLTVELLSTIDESTEILSVANLQDIVSSSTDREPQQTVDAPDDRREDRMKLTNSSKSNCTEIAAMSNPPLPDETGPLSSTFQQLPSATVKGGAGRRIALGGLQRERPAAALIRRSAAAASAFPDPPPISGFKTDQVNSNGTTGPSEDGAAPLEQHKSDCCVVGDMITALSVGSQRLLPTGSLEEGSMGNWLASRTSTSPKKLLPPSDEKPQATSGNRLGDIEIGDLDAVDENTSGLVVSPDASHAWLTMPTGAPLDANMAANLKMLMLGNFKKDFPEEWKMQSFTLSKNPELTYGLIQKKGGPCGVLACVQAYLLKELLFSKGRRTLSKSGGSGFVDDEISRCLALAFASVLWKAGDQKTATVAFPSSRNSFADERPGLCDGFVEKINLMKFTDLAALHSFLNRHVSWYSSESGRGACVAFLYSAVLSRGIDNVKKDMDDANNCLIGQHGYCSQEVINLLLTGQASSNVFDNVVILDEGMESQSTFKGVTRRSDFGLLALFEHYNSCQVGKHLKCPRYPIWVVCSESHYSVLFAKDYGAICANSGRSNNSSQLEQSKFDLYFYDGLLQQEREIRLTVDLSEEKPPIKHHKDAVPPLDLCIRTKWNGAVVDWNGTEPLL